MRLRVWDQEDDQMLNVVAVERLGMGNAGRAPV
jgi:hypothetical protein